MREGKKGDDEKNPISRFDPKAKAATRDETGERIEGAAQEKQKRCLLVQSMSDARSMFPLAHILIKIIIASTTTYSVGQMRFRLILRGPHFVRPQINLGPCL